MVTEFLHFDNVTICTMRSDTTGQTFVGMAKCAPEDEDKYNERTGENIAEARAAIELLRSCRASLIDTIATQEHLMGCMEQSNSFNPKCNEFRLLRRNYHDNIDILAEIRNQIVQEQRALDYYIGRI